MVMRAQREVVGMLRVDALVAWLAVGNDTLRLLRHPMPTAFFQTISGGFGIIGLAVHTACHTHTWSWVHVRLFPVLYWPDYPMTAGYFSRSRFPEDGKSKAYCNQYSRP